MRRLFQENHHGTSAGLARGEYGKRLIVFTFVYTIVYTIF